jgi:transposase
VTRALNPDHLVPGCNEPFRRVPSDLPWVHRELLRTGMTLQQLWIEYRDDAAAGLPWGGTPDGYSQLCDLYADFRQPCGPVDAPGAPRRREELHRLLGQEAADLVVGHGRNDRDRALRRGAARLELHIRGGDVDAEAGGFLASTMRALEFFGGVPKVAVPDQLRSAVNGPDRYDPEINPTYAELAQHYDLAVVPARPREGAGQGEGRGAVVVAQRWILACLRNRTFVTIDDLNMAIAELVEKLNERPFKKLEGRRRSAFETLDRPEPRPVPTARWELARWAKGPR